MFKRIVTSTLMIGAAMSIIPAMASAQEFRGDRDHVRYEDQYRDRRELRDHDRDERFRAERFREERAERFRDARYPGYEGRGFYDRFGCWHRY
jgi:Ni/Co efflux regulator RcnB